MKTSLLASLVFLVAGVFATADSTVVLNGVHNCCKKCDTGINEAIAKVEGASAKVEKNKVSITAKDEATAKQAVASLLKGGYYGQGAEAPAVTDAKVKSATISGLHLCCGKCVTAAEGAILSVAGVSKHDAVKGASSVTVEGDFSVQALNDALHKAGFHGAIK
jgi:hypothetical protein